jgi:predicted transcriptional regulator
VIFLDYLSPLRSELKLKILLNLLNGEKKIADLRADVETRDTTILHILEEFGDLNLITKEQGIYKLSPLGLIEAKIFKEYLLTSKVMEKFKDFWLLHNIADISPCLLLNLNALADSLLIRNEASKIGVVHKTFLETFKQSKWFKGISPVFHSDFISQFGQQVEQGSIIELIVSEDVLRNVMDVVDFKLIKKYLVAGTLKVFLNNDVKIALALTESSFSLGLFTLSGTYDDSMDLFSSSNYAIQWGERLFEDIIKSSKKINLDSLA